MICQCCGRGIPLIDTCIIEFKGNLVPINAKWIACKKCTWDLYLDCYNHFPHDLLKRNLKIYYAIGEEIKKK